MAAPAPEVYLPAGRASSPLLASVLGGVTAAAVACGAMVLLRWTLQLRSLPERLMEWLLLFIPLDLFEAGLQQFGFEAKRWVLYAAIAGMFGLLAGLGAIALWRRWSLPALLGLGLGLWLFTLLVIMPLTGAGFLALALIHEKRTAILGYLGIALVYAAVLGMIRASRSMAGIRPALSVRSSPPTSRRSALVLLGSALAAYGAAYAAQLLPRSVSGTPVLVLDPQDPVPSGGIDPPGAHPHEAAPRPPAAGPPIPAEATEPPPARLLARDKDGATLASGRRRGQLAELITRNDDFYIVSKNAAGDPDLHAGSWRLVVDGEVHSPIQLDYASLRNLPSVEVTKTLECISNLVAQCELASFGCDLISTARWRGVPVSTLLELAGGLKRNAVALAVISADEYTTALPLEVARAPDTLLVHAMNGQVLPREHGYPARVLVPGRYGMKNAKWVVALRAMSREFLDWYGQRQWSQQAIVKTMTRIDYPAPGALLPPGEHGIAGVAYAGDRGVAKVEFSADGGATWAEAELLDRAVGRDTWVRWRGLFTLPDESEATLVARATDRTGSLQSEAFSLAQPDGASGWHSIEVRAPRP